MNPYISKTLFSCSSLDFRSSISQSLWVPSSTTSCRAMSSTSCWRADTVSNTQQFCLSLTTITLQGLQTVSPTIRATYILLRDMSLRKTQLREDKLPHCSLLHLHPVLQPHLEPSRCLKLSPAWSCLSLEATTTDGQAASGHPRSTVFKSSRSSFHYALILLPCWVQSGWRMIKGVLVQQTGAFLRVFSLSKNCLTLGSKLPSSTQ